MQYWAETEITFLRPKRHVQKVKNVERHSPRPLLNIRHLLDPLISLCSQPVMDRKIKKRINWRNDHAGTVNIRAKTHAYWLTGKTRSAQGCQNLTNFLWIGRSECSQNSILNSITAGTIAGFFKRSAVNSSSFRGPRRFSWFFHWIAELYMQNQYTV
jgi:hypothetical protein